MKIQVEQVAPFTVKAVGTTSLLVQVPWKPSDVFAPFRRPGGDRVS
jgi:hypothetical protein